IEPQTERTAQRGLIAVKAERAHPALRRLRLQPYRPVGARLIFVPVVRVELRLGGNVEADWDELALISEDAVGDRRDLASWRIMLRVDDLDHARTGRPVVVRRAEDVTGDGVDAWVDCAQIPAHRPVRLGDTDRQARVVGGD